MLIPADAAVLDLDVFTRNRRDGAYESESRWFRDTDLIAVDSNNAQTH